MLPSPPSPPVFDIAAGSNGVRSASGLLLQVFHDNPLVGNYHSFRQNNLGTIDRDTFSVLRWLKTLLCRCTIPLSRTHEVARL